MRIVAKDLVRQIFSDPFVNICIAVFGSGCMLVPILVLFFFLF